MGKLRDIDRRLVQEALELTGINEVQLKHIMHKIEFAVDNAVLEALREAKTNE